MRTRFSMGSRCLGVAAIVATASVLSLSGAPATAEDPPGCNANNLNINLNVNPNSVPNGTKVTYEVDVSNGGTLACNVSLATVTFCCPGADGLPLSGPGGCTDVPVTTSPCEVNGAANCSAVGGTLEFPASGFGDIQVKGLQCTIDVNQGVTMARAKAQVNSGYLLAQASGITQPELAKLLDVIISEGPTQPEPKQTPAATPAGLAAILLLLLGAGVWLTRRRTAR